MRSPFSFAKSPLSSDLVAMRILIRYTWALVPALMLLAGCATRPDGARLSSSEAARMAKQAARHDGISLRHYKRPEAQYRDDRTWFVFFDGRGLFRTAGSFFAVAVDDQTGAARVSRGM